MSTSAPLDLDGCAAEPIRIPGGIQPHGLLLVLHPQTGELLQASANAEALLGVDPAGITMGKLLGPKIEAWTRGNDASLLMGATINGRAFDVVGHRTAQGIVVELELPVPDGPTLESLYPRLQAFADNAARLDDLRVLARLAAAEIRSISGFDRVLVYDFDEVGHGTVLAEDGNDLLPSYLDLRFPASDIPAQARELYRLNPVRIIPDANYVSQPLVPQFSPLDGQPLDLSLAGLRSVSPVHLQYMRNMGTLSSMSISILVEDALWGLISCHHHAPLRVSPQARTACNFVGKIVALKVDSIQRGAHAKARIALKQRESELVARLSRATSIQSGLAENASIWLGLTNAQGAAVVIDDAVRAVGEHPGEEAIRELASFLHARGVKDRFVSDALAQDWPPAARFAAAASGVIAISISQLHASYVMWFRPELVRTVTWAGEPKKASDSPDGRLQPRASFAQWSELVRNRAQRWSPAERESAEDFRNAVINVVLLRAEERAQLTEELERSNKELESFSYSVSHDLRAPFRHIVGYAELLRDYDRNLDSTARRYLANIIDAALSAGQLVDDLLSFSQLGRTSLSKARVDMRKLVAEVQMSVEPDAEGRDVEWRIGALPNAWGDASLLRQALANLVGNALKYSRNRDRAIISISGEQKAGETVFKIEDNGVGFDMAYVDKLFGVFQRLHRVEEFEGTGIGLALTKRVIDRHGGWIRAHGALDVGATFTFGLPNRTQETTIE